MDTSEISELTEFAIELAREAGEITLKHFRRLSSVDRKRDGSFVTVADREAELHIRARITARFPDDAIIGEEHGEQRGDSARCWIIDPIDGTYSFVKGVPLYGVLIGLEVSGDAVSGVANFPSLGQLYHGARGLGAFCDGERIRVSGVAALEQALALATDFGPIERFGLPAIPAQLQRRAHVRRTWGDCYGYAMVASGRAEMMFDQAMNVWDCAALKPLIEEAGGRFTDWSGKPTIRGGNAVATNGRLHDEVVSILKARPR
ncbi:MAG TPA: histidinol-phosphatase [Candidatus Binataceae bacterium]